MRVRFEKEILELKKQLLQLQKENIELRRRLAAYENSNTPSSKERFKKRKEGNSSGKIGRPPGAEGSTRPIAKPDETISVTEDECPDCKRKLREPLYFERKVIEETPDPQPVKVTEFFIAHYICKCGKHITAKHKDCPQVGRFGPNLQAEIASMRVEERLTLRKICASLQRRYALRITPATVLEILERAKICLQNDYEKIIALIKTAKILNADETVFRVNGKDWRLWVFRTKTEILLLLRDSRGMKIVQEVLEKKSDRIIGCDGYSAYFSFGVIQRCWSHLIRKLKFISDANEKFKPFLEELRGFFHKLKEKVALKPPPEIRKQIATKAQEELQRFIDTAKSHKELKDFVTYAENGMPNWFTFILSEGVEPANNSAEQALREHIVIRKIIGTLRNQRGTDIYEVLASVFATWNAKGLNPQVELASALRS